MVALDWHAISHSHFWPNQGFPMILLGHECPCERVLILESVVTYAPHCW
jgi:hypothetical protein